MKRIQLALIVAALLLPFQPAIADDPPAPGDDTGYGAGAATASKDAARAPPGDATQTIQVEEVQTGAASMEPKDDESPAERSERAFIENVWNSP
jgi:hypothetical protein